MKIKKVLVLFAFFIVSAFCLVGCHPSETIVVKNTLTIVGCSDNIVLEVENDSQIEVPYTQAMQDYELANKVVLNGFFIYDNEQMLPLINRIIKVEKDVIIYCDWASVGLEYGEINESGNIANIDVDKYSNDYNTYNFQAYGIVGYDGEGEAIIVPNFYQDKPIKSVAGKTINYQYKGAFSNIGQTSNVEIRLPQGIEFVGKLAFFKANISNIELPLGVKVIGEYAFCDCQLESLTLLEDSKIAIIGAGAFYNCDLLENVELGQSLEAIGTLAFADCNNLTNVKLNSQHINSIKHQAFGQCGKLEEVIFPSKIEQMQSYIFLGSTQVKVVTTGKYEEVFSANSAYNWLQTEQDRARYIEIVFEAILVKVDLNGGSYCGKTGIVDMWIGYDARTYDGTAQMAMPIKEGKKCSQMTDEDEVAVKNTGVLNKNYKYKNNVLIAQY